MCVVMEREKRGTDDSFQIRTGLYLACRAANLSSLQARTTTRFPSNLLLCSKMSERMRSRPRSTTWSNRGRWGDQSTSWRVMTNSERRIRAKLHLYIGRQNIELDEVRQSIMLNEYTIVSGHFPQKYYINSEPATLSITYAKLTAV